MPDLEVGLTLPARLPILLSKWYLFVPILLPSEDVSGGETAVGYVQA